MHDTIRNYGLASRIIMGILCWLIAEMVMWSITSNRDGVEIAAIMGATLIPIVGLFRFVMDWADRKRQQ